MKCKYKYNINNKKLKIFGYNFFNYKQRALLFIITMIIFESNLLVPCVYSIFLFLLIFEIFSSFH